jgi:hypothetical protein
MFTEKDLAQIADHGQTPEAVEQQMESFRRGFPFLSVVRAATVGDGIFRADVRYADLYRNSRPRVVKFVPASGAATRMFKELFAFVETGVPNASAARTVDNIEKFAFYGALNHGEPVAQAVLDYGARLPKGLILFHKYATEVRTAAEEHLVEGAQYGVGKVHFTVSPEHEKGFRELLEKYAGDFEISFSQQLPSTDTIAATPDNQPFREKDGRLLFRPAGHGALIANLDRLDADLIFIKNIDNVTVDRLRADTILYKEILGGMALALQERIFGFLRGASADGMREFIEEELCYKLPPDASEEYMRGVLDRPLRVCAMVRNEGEPGGGPFWVANADGSEQLQIGESSQVAPADKHIFSGGTHFNPVDIVCAVRDHRGGKFDLLKFTDPATGFISEKSKDGRTLKAQELPGLWNGAMARWNTVFVEAPISTFTPVKEVNDLLREAHNGQ